jgi:hypothetical protein
VFDESIDKVRADEAGPAGDDDAHGYREIVVVVNSPLPGRLLRGGIVGTDASWAKLDGGTVSVTSGTVELPPLPEPLKGTPAMARASSTPTTTTSAITQRCATTGLQATPTFAEGVTNRR